MIRGWHLSSLCAKKKGGKKEEGGVDEKPLLRKAGGKLGETKSENWNFPYTMKKEESIKRQTSLQGKEVCVSPPNLFPMPEGERKGRRSLTGAPLKKG